LLALLQADGLRPEAGADVRADAAGSDGSPWPRRNDLRQDVADLDMGQAVDAGQGLADLDDDDAVLALVLVAGKTLGLDRLVLDGGDLANDDGVGLGQALGSWEGRGPFERKRLNCLGEHQTRQAGEPGPENTFHQDSPSRGFKG